MLQQQGLPAHFELLEDDAEAVREVWPPFLQTVAESASLRADYEAVVARHGRSQTHKALAAALAKRVEFDLADAAGVADASVPPFQQAYPELAALAEPAEALLLLAGAGVVAVVLRRRKPADRVVAPDEEQEW